MNDRIRLTEQARRDLRWLDRQVAARIIEALERLAEANVGDLRRLKGREREFRLRVGDWRVRLDIDPASGTILVNRILPRGRAYRD